MTNGVPPNVIRPPVINAYILTISIVVNVSPQVINKNGCSDGFQIQWSKIKKKKLILSERKNVILNGSSTCAQDEEKIKTNTCGKSKRGVVDKFFFFFKMRPFWKLNFDGEIIGLVVFFVNDTSLIFNIEALLRRIRWWKKFSEFFLYKILI